MEISSAIMAALYTVSISLLYPVVLVLLGLLMYSLLLVGSFVSEYAQRNRDINRMETECKRARKKVEEGNQLNAAEIVKHCGSNEFLVAFTKDLAKLLNRTGFSLNAEKLLQDYEIKISKELEHVKLLARVGPMFGLMGTLIPMGPALIGLAAGNIQQLASNLVIAFGTTVVGLLVGIIGYSISMVKRRWYAQDLSDMEYIVELLVRKDEKEA
ncbi:Biopolymer transport protein ExbB/TolQ [Candidatus Methanophagaceae archaeon]|nr:Biopolymer transport protein ExbB/TolQ [Methanophagales archaeon]